MKKCRRWKKTMMSANFRPAVVDDDVLSAMGVIFQEADKAWEELLTGAACSDDGN